MVQNQVTALGCNHRNGAFRQARPLAEGQKSADVKHDFTIPPPRQPRQLAEGVEFPERYADFSPFAPSFGGGGRISREKWRSLAPSPIIGRRGCHASAVNLTCGVRFLC